jgi:hypothetical protein
MPWAMRPSKDRILRIGFVKMHRVAVGRDLGKQFDIAIGDLLAQMARHADLDILDADRAARQVVVHRRIEHHHNPPRSMLRCNIERQAPHGNPARKIFS